jgi:SAM-dependent methyltransferase
VVGLAAARPLLRAAGVERLGDWVTDRRVRRPSGTASRENYRDPAYHWPNFDAVLEALALGPSDRLLEVGCGGGAFLSAALHSGCTAAAVDHAPDIVRLARVVNADAIASGRLEIMRADALALPFAAESFTAAAMTGVLAFLTDQAAALAEIDRVLASDGRLMLFTAPRRPWPARLPRPSPTRAACTSSRTTSSKRWPAKPASVTRVSRGRTSVRSPPGAASRTRCSRYSRPRWANC